MREQAMRTTKGLRIGRVALIACALAGAWLQVPAAQVAQGRWNTVLTSGGLPALVTINPVHMALMHNGKVLIVAGSGNVAAERNFRAMVWDPQTGTFSSAIPLAWDMFCNGMVALPDGQIFINGGNLAYDPFWGERRTALFDPAAGVFTNIQNMAHGRWYPTVTALGDGSIMTFSGLLDTGGTNSSVEIYTPGSGWSPEYMAGWTPPLYPRMHLLTDGKVAYVGSTTPTRTFDPVAHTWSAIITNSTRNRNYGTSVLLPLSPADSYKSRVMIFGGGNPSVASTEIIDFSVAAPRWQLGPAMSQPRIQMNATILPDGKVLVTGGSYNDEDAATASRNADLDDPATNTFSPAGANAFPRLYHSNALLLPDATVLLAGGNPQRGNYEARMEIYSPAYLFNGADLAERPVIQSLPNLVNYGGTFQVHTQAAADIASVVLVRPGAPTHAFDMDQRLVKLSYTVGSGLLNVTAPPHGNIAPPGYYMLFILNAAGVPSVAKFVQLSGTASPNQAPTATITNPAADVTISAGQAVSFAGTGNDPEGGISAYAWTFAGGNPASSLAAVPGPVVYSTPGTYAASLMVTDEGGLTSPSATRTITVTAPADFSISALQPASQTVQPGGKRPYTLTVTPSGGFSGAVTFAVSGVPSGASPSFNPASVTTSGTTTLTVATTAATPPGTYQITVTGTGGTLARTANVTLTVTAPANFSLSAAPASQTVQPGGSAAYTLTVTPSGGFSGAVTFGVSGVPLGHVGVVQPRARSPRLAQRR